MERDTPRILVVDDEPDMCWALENILRPVGYTVTTATSGMKALELVTRECYAAAFIDAKLPDLDGLKLVTLIHQQCAHTAIVLISGYYYQEDPAINEGIRQDTFIGFIAKPFDLAQVRHLALRAVDLARKGGDGYDAHSPGG